MPIINKCGISKTTPFKQIHFRLIIRTHLKIVQKISAKYPKTWADHTYYYFDLNSGPGILNNQIGSPIIFLEEAIKTKLNIEAHFYEINKKNLSILTNYISKQINIPSRINIHFHLGNSRTQIRRYCHVDYQNSKTKKFGLLYNDPNGLPFFDSISHFFKIKAFEKLDILINCCCGDLKRVRNCSRTNENRNLNELLKLINKKHWLIRKPYDCHQWSFFLGSNWDNFPQFKHLDIYKRESQVGQKIFNKLNYTAKELKCQNQKLDKKPVNFI